MLNARRHRSGENAPRRSLLPPWPLRAQRPKASERREPPDSAVRRAQSFRAQRPKASERREPQGRLMIALIILLCSTPEGIGAARTPAPKTDCCNVLCSTPEGIGAARTRVVDVVITSTRVLNARRHRSGENAPVAAIATLHVVCSTPEGIGAARTCRSLMAPRSVGRVLNARRHRSGENSRADRISLARAECSTPEGIGAARTGW